MAIVSDLLQLCRLCLVKDEVNVPIFEGESDDQQISLKISSCLPVTLSQDDRLPQKICSECCRKLDTLYEFRNSSVNAEKQLVTWLEELENQSKKTSEKMSIATESLSEKTIVKEEIDEVDENGALSNEAEDYILQQQVAYDKTDLLNDAADETGEPQPKRAKRAAALKALIHTQESEEDEEDIDEPEPITKAEEESEPSETDINESVDDTFAGGPSTSADDQPGPSGVGKSTEGPSNICFPSHREGFNDNYKISDANNVNERSKSNKKTKRPTLCTICGEKYESDGDVLKHRNMHSLQTEFPCFVCKKIFKDRTYIRKHVRNHLAEVGHFPCSVCYKAFKNEKALRVHQKRHDLSQYKYTCQECGRMFMSQSFYKDHFMSQHENIPFQCDICNKKFKNKTTLVTHKKSHMEGYTQANYTCDQCNKTFEYPSVLKYHKETIHDKITKHVCNICNYKFSFVSNLLRHIRSVHQRSSQFCCDVCGKVLASLKGLQKHMRTHTGERPFSCEFCEKAFTCKGDLIPHIRTHTKEKPYKCDQCGRCFTQSGSLRFHIRKFHTNDLRYECLICQKKFVISSHLKRHTSMHHGVSTDDSNPLDWENL